MNHFVTDFLYVTEFIWWATEVKDFPCGSIDVVVVKNLRQSWVFFCIAYTKWWSIHWGWDCCSHKVVEVIIFVYHYQTSFSWFIFKAAYFHPFVIFSRNWDTWVMDEPLSFKQETYIWILFQFFDHFGSQGFSNQPWILVWREEQVLSLLGLPVETVVGWRFCSVCISGTERF